MIDKFKLNEEEIQQNYKEFIDFIKESFSGKRKEKLLKMYSENELGIELSTAPASMSEHFHLCYPGGYIQHIMNVVKNSFGQKKLFEMGGGIVDWTNEEMIFSALHHDLGKLGDPTEFGSYYITQTENWKLKKGENYQMNPKLPYMEVADRAIYLLQKYGIVCTWKEFLSIKLADGIYNEANKKYLIQYNTDLILKTTLPKIIHLADYISCFTEYNKFVNFKSEEML
jgi:hypothetical protein